MLNEFGKSAFGVQHRNKDHDDEIAAGVGGAAGARGGASIGAGGEVGLRNTGRAVNHYHAQGGKTSALRQLGTVSRTPGVGRVAAGAAIGGGALAFGAKAGMDKWKKERPSNKAKITGGVIAGGVAAAAGIKGGRNYQMFRQAAKTHHAFANDPARAKKLATDLSQVHSSKSNFDVNFRSKKPLNDQARREAQHLNPDTKHVRRAVDDWSRSPKSANSYRNALKQEKAPNTLHAIINPKARNWHQARTLRTLQDNAPKSNRTLHRATDLPSDTDLTPGAKLGVHHLSSWSDNPKVADQFSAKQKQRKGGMGYGRKANKGNSEPALLRVNGAKGFHAAPASRHFTQNEWLAGGNMKIRSVTHDKKSGRKIIDLDPED